jgi:hypothetical protein
VCTTSLLLLPMRVWVHVFIIGVVVTFFCRLVGRRASKSMVMGSRSFALTFAKTIVSWVTVCVLVDTHIIDCSAKYAAVNRHSYCCIAHLTFSCAPSTGNKGKSLTSLFMFSDNFGAFFYTCNLL